MLGKRKINYTFCTVHIKIYKKGGKFDWKTCLYVYKPVLIESNLSLFRVYASLWHDSSWTPSLFWGVRASPCSTQIPGLLVLQSKGVFHFAKHG